METILIVEDDPTMLRGLKDNFEFKGYKVLTASDGEKGLEAALNAKPDLILLDIMLPKINGYEICRLIREQKLDMPIIMLTAKGEESDIVLGLNLAQMIMSPSRSASKNCSPAPPLSCAGQKKKLRIFTNSAATASTFPQDGSREKERKSSCPPKSSTFSRFSSKGRAALLPAMKS